MNIFVQYSGHFLLKFDKKSFDHDWDALIDFLDQARDKATSTKVLLSCYGSKTDAIETSCSKCGSSSHKKAACTVRISAVKTEEVESDETSDDDGDAARLRREKDKEVKKRVRDQCGKCPLCKKRHTFIRKRDGKEWPSDRFISCPQFQKISVVERAIAIARLRFSSVVWI